MKHRSLTFVYVLLAVSFTIFSCKKKAAHPESAWKRVNIPYSGQILSMAFTSPTTGYATGQPVYDPIHKSARTPLLRTTDGGLTWLLDTMKIANAAINHIQAAGSILFAQGTYPYNNNGNYYGMYRSADQGASWQLVDSNETHQNVRFLDANRGVAIYSTSIYQTTNGGEDFIKAADLPPNTSWGAVSPAGGNTAYLYSGFIMEKTTDGGSTWSKLPFNFPSGIYHVKFLNPDQGYVILFEIFYSVNTITTSQVKQPIILYRTTDGGNTWTLVNDKIADTISYPGDVDFVSPTEGYITNTTIIYATYDGGKSWKPEFDTGPQNDSSFYPSYFCSVPGGNILFAYGLNGMVRKAR